MAQGAMAEAPFIVAGGGIAGLATALAMAPAPVLVLERAPAFEEVGAGLQLGPNAVRALQELGAWDAVEPFTSAPPEIHIRDGLTGQVLKRLRLKGNFEKKFGVPYRVVHRSDLHQALLSVARNKQSLSLETNHEVSSWRDSTSGGKATTTVEHQIAGRFLFACDGVNSGLRQIAFPGTTPVDSGFTLHRALLASPPAPAGIEWDCVNLWLSSNAHIVHYPVGKSRRLNIVATVRTGVLLAQAHAQSCPGIQDLLAAVSNWLPWPGLYLEPLRHWRKGNMVLLGDAAHGTLPFLAQGAAMALEDGAGLKTLGPLASVSTEALDKFLATRRARTTRLHLETFRMVQRYHASAAMRLPRNLLLQAAPAEWLMAGLAWIYREQ
jgi:2-polyprenyl-6-methoxyphenol hydroxylase-like FAD-dependent oxidoreductase